jgi:hypothetical protein
MLAGATTQTPCKIATLFRRPSLEKVAPSGQFERERGACSVPCMSDGLSTLYQDLLKLPACVRPRLRRNRGQPSIRAISLITVGSTGRRLPLPQPVPIARTLSNIALSG